MDSNVLLQLFLKYKLFVSKNKDLYVLFQQYLNKWRGWFQVCQNIRLNEPHAFLYLKKKENAF